MGQSPPGPQQLTIVPANPAAVKASEIRAALVQEQALWQAHQALAQQTLSGHLPPALAEHFQAELAGAQFELAKIAAKFGALDALYPTISASTGPAVGP